jgi:hypothetical protein
MIETVQIAHDPRRVEHRGARFEDDDVWYLVVFPLISDQQLNQSDTDGTSPHETGGSIDANLG